MSGSDGTTVNVFEGSRHRRSYKVHAIECHGLAADHTGGFWVADPGEKARLVGGAVQTVSGIGAVIYVDPSGRRQRRIDPPTSHWRPTAVALDDFGRGSEGRLWVADGYGLGLVHCFDSTGAHEWSIDGASSGVAFSCPHALAIDRRGDRPFLLVADRGNRRIVVLTTAGEYVREFGANVLTSPSGLAVGTELLWVAELLGSIASFDRRDQPHVVMGENTVNRTSDWPNACVGDRIVAPTVPLGRFRSPHGIAVLENGDLAVAEWLVDGRVTLLEWRDD